MDSPQMGQMGIGRDGEGGKLLKLSEAAANKFPSLRFSFLLRLLRDSAPGWIEQR